MLLGSPKSGTCAFAVAFGLGTRERWQRLGLQALQGRRRRGTRGRYEGRRARFIARRKRNILLG